MSISIKWYLVADVLALACTALRIRQWYFSRPLWLDEEMILLNVRDRSVSDLVGNLWLDQAAPFGWLALQRVIMTLFGADDRSVRALPVLCGIAVIWVAWWMARRWMNPLAAAAFVGFCGFGQWMNHYALEAKAYSADAFLALALPALTIWATETGTERPLHLRRTAIWWGVAAAAQWFSYGATLVTPACAVVLCATAWRRARWRAATIVASQGLIWLASFGAHYWLSIQDASSDEYLRNYWAAGFPPAAAGAATSLMWLANQAKPLASHPGGTALWLPFWLAAGYGTAKLLLKRPVVGLVILFVPVSGFLLALMRQAPLADRLALWTTPALYAAVAIAVGDVLEHRRPERSLRAWAVFGMAIVFTLVAWRVSADLISRGRDGVFLARDNHGLDDARGMRLLMRQRQPGDVLLTTHFGLPAVWWYGDVDVSDPHQGARFPDGAPLFEVRHVGFGVEGCRRSTQLRALSIAFVGAPRAMVFLGFDSNSPLGFQQMVLDHLARLGARTFYSRVESEGIVAIYDLRVPPDSPVEDQDQRPALTGCVSTRPARRW